jgi:hypothetical protein
VFKNPDSSHVVVRFIPSTSERSETGQPVVRFFVDPASIWKTGRSIPLGQRYGRQMSHAAVPKSQAGSGSRHVSFAEIRLETPYLVSLKTRALDARTKAINVGVRRAEKTRAAQQQGRRRDALNNSEQRPDPVRVTRPRKAEFRPQHWATANLSVTQPPEINHGSPITRICVRLACGADKEPNPRASLSDRKNSAFPR